jgi:hypothetical protein
MTPTSEAASRVFISYAHKDGAPLGQRLRADLKGKGFDTWLDTQRLTGGDIIFPPKWNFHYTIFG